MKALLCEIRWRLRAYAVVGSAAMTIVAGTGAAVAAANPTIIPGQSCTDYVSNSSSESYAARDCVDKTSSIQQSFEVHNDTAKAVLFQGFQRKGGTVVGPPEGMWVESGDSATFDVTVSVIKHTWVALFIGAPGTTNFAVTMTAQLKVRPVGGGPTTIVSNVVCSPEGRGSCDTNSYDEVHMRD